MRRMRFPAAALCSVAAVLAGCATGGAPRQGPDLVAEPVPGGVGTEGFCRIDNHNTLVVRVRNRGSEDADSPSDVMVLFPGGSAPQYAQAAPVGAGTSVSVSMPVPENCFSPSCDFLITVDANNAILETDEGNNGAEGSCAG
ncbi:MAG: hypothetical protein M3Z21_11825 [Pseudomonadota bacterium]|nr:hypothetical protein [Pseudomonadota bacterium]